MMTKQAKIPLGKHNRLKSLVVFVLLLSIFPLGQALAEDSPEELARQGFEAIRDWQMEDAAEIASTILDEGYDTIPTRRFLAEYYFNRADYPEAMTHLEAIRGKYEVPEHGFEIQLEAVASFMTDYFSKKSEHFEFRSLDPEDEILADEALETLEREYEALREDMGYAPPDRIALEVYPSLKHLAQATGLTVKDLKTSGVIAICKFNRLMITTPRASLMGYRWRDTASHEYVHLVINRASRATVPIWLHEGLAKYHEIRWRSEEGKPLEPSSEDLLAVALRENSFVTFDEMHPSMAYLPSQDHTALAFAEVQTVIHWLKIRNGKQSIHSLLTTLRDTDGDLETTFRKVYGFGFSQLFDRWKLEVSKWGLKTLPAHAGKARDYAFIDVSDPAAKDIGDDPESIEQEKARNFVTLGKLLKDRNRPRAALTEFEKAQRLIGSKSNLTLQNMIAEIALTLENPQAALDNLRDVHELYPSYVGTVIRLARAYSELEQWDQAALALEEAEAINPFDPRVQMLRIHVYSMLGQDRVVEHAKESLKKIRG